MRRGGPNEPRDLSGVLSALRWRRRFIVLSLLAALPVIWLIFKDHPVHRIGQRAPTSIPAFVVGILAVAQHFKYRKRYKQDLVAAVVKDHFPDVMYRPESHTNEATARRSGLFPNLGKYKFHGEDLVVLTYRTIRVKFSELRLTQGPYVAGLKSKYSHWALFVECQLPFRNAGRLYVDASPAGEHASLRQALMTMAQSGIGHDPRLVLEDGLLQIAFASGRDRFEPPALGAIDEARVIADVRDELSRFFSVKAVVDAALEYENKA